jgi:hypothetical protein
MGNKHRFGLSSVIFVCIAACGGEPPPPPARIAAPPPSAAPMPPPPAARARWVFAHPERGLNAKLDLGDGQTLFVGQYGRRALAKADGALTDAPTLALEHLTGVLRDGADWVFVAEDGDAYVSQDALGSLGPARPGPLGDGTDGKPSRFTSIATGKASIVGITLDGRMLRSGDFGKSWAPVDFAGATKAFGHPYQVAMDTKGNGLLIALPQRIYLTRDDGATWTQIPSLGIGASSVKRDGADRLFLQGNMQHAKLDGGQLAITTDSYEPLRKTPPPPSGSSGSSAPAPTEPSSMLLAGNRVVELTLHRGARPTVEVASRKLGEPASGPGVMNGDLVSARSGGYNEGNVSPHVAAYNNNLIYVRADDTKDADGAVTTTVLTSSDFGATWKTDGTFKGHVIDHGFNDRGQSPVAIGPNGWAYVRAMCPQYVSSESNDKCTHAQVRLAASSTFEDLASVEDVSPLQFAFDEAHNKVYVLGKHDGRTHVYESTLNQNKLSRLKVLDATGTSAISVEPSGTLRVVTYDWQIGQWKILRHALDGSDLPPLFGPPDSGEIAMVGQRGVISGGHSA